MGEYVPKISQPDDTAHAETACDEARNSDSEYTGDGNERHQPRDPRPGSGFHVNK